MNVDKNVPIPKKYPFAQMQVGDSFVIADSIKRTTVSVASIRYGKATGKKFTTRKMPEGVYRCWRIE